MCRGEIFFARPCAIRAQSRNHQTWPHHKSWCAPNVTTCRTCRGEIFFAPTCAIHTQSPGYQQSPRHDSWRPPNVTTNRMCRGEIFFARPCAIRAQSRNHQTWPHHKSWCAPNVTTHRMCRGEIFFARPCATHSQSPNHQTSPRHESWCAPQIAPCITYVRAKNISPVRAPLTLHQSHVVIARAPHAATPRLCGRKIFRPYVCQLCPIDHRSPSRARWVPDRPASAPRHAP